MIHPVGQLLHDSSRADEALAFAIADGAGLTIVGMHEDSML